MATYINGLTDYIPQVQPFKPDYNFYAGVLQQKQSQYDQNYNQINSVYGSLLNSPMTKDINNKRRDDYFKMADNAIKKISGLDLSLEENADQAYGVFKPFYSDNNMMKDMTWTKNYNNEMSRAESFRNCIDPKKCGGQYWDTGVAALNYKRDEFRNTDDQQALGFNNVRFVPQVNITEKATEAAKAAGFNIKIDELKGGYIVTTKNGQLLEPHLQSYFAQLFGNDTAVTDMYKTKAYVQRKDFIAQNAQAGIDPQAAEEMYIKTFTNTIVPQQEKQRQEALNTYDNLVVKKNAVDKDIEENGILVNADNVKAYSDIVDQLSIAESGKEHHDQAQNYINAIKNSSNTHMMMDQVDNLVAMNMFGSEINNVAHTLAYRDYEVSMQADQFALQSQASALSLKNSLTMKNADYTMWLAQQQYLEHKEDAKRKGGADSNTPSFTDTAPGTSTPPVNGSDAYNINKNKSTETILSNTAPKETYVIDLANSIKAEYNAANSQNEKELIKAAAQKLFEGTNVKPEQLFSGDPASIVKNLSKNKSGVDASTIYDRSLALIDPDAPIYGSINQWATDFWGKSKQQRQDIKNQDIVIDNSASFFKKQSETTLDQLKGKVYDNDYNDVAYLDHFLDDNGQPKTREEFAKDVANDPKINSLMKPQVVISGPAGEVRVPMELDKQGKIILPARYANLTDIGVRVENTKEKANMNASNKYDEYYKNYINTYKETASPYNGLVMLGNKGGGYTSKAMTYGKVDPYEYKSEAVLQARSFFNDYKKLETNPSTKVFFGDTDKESPKTDDKAQVILNQLIADFGKNYDKEEEKGRPTFSMRYQNVAGNSEKNTALRIIPNQDWIDAHKGTLKDPGITRNEDLSKGLVIYLPAAEAQNAMSQATKVSQNDWILEQTGVLKFDQNPQGGNISLTKKDGTYRANGYINRVNPTTGAIEKVSVSETYNANLSADVISANWNNALAVQEQSVANDIEILKANGLGTKNPNDLKK